MATSELASDVLDWLLAGDVAVAHQATRDLLHRDDRHLQRRIATEGVGAALLAARGPDGHWGRGFYQPKWTSSHYTLLELRNLGLPQDNETAHETVELILATTKTRDGGVDPRRQTPVSDTCVNGMALNYLSYFGATQEQLASIVDSILARRVHDGGFNCQNRPGHPVDHSSLHTTVSVLEGIAAYRAAGHVYRAADLDDAAASSVEFLLRHQLFRSERSGEVIRPEFLRLHHPARWHFDVLRGLDCLVALGIPRDARMEAALDVLVGRRRVDGRWKAAAAWPGQTHTGAEPGRTASRWVTLIALRVLTTFGVLEPSVRDKK